MTPIVQAAAVALVAPRGGHRRDGHRPEECGFAVPAGRAAGNELDGASSTSRRDRGTARNANTVHFGRPRSSRRAAGYSTADGRTDVDGKARLHLRTPPVSDVPYGGLVRHFQGGRCGCGHVDNAGWYGREINPVAKGRRVSPGARRRVEAARAGNLGPDLPGIADARGRPSCVVAPGNGAEQ